MNSFAQFLAMVAFKSRQDFISVCTNKISFTVNDKFQFLKTRTDHSSIQNAICSLLQHGLYKFFEAIQVEGTLQSITGTSFQLNDTEKVDDI